METEFSIVKKGPSIIRILKSCFCDFIMGQYTEGQIHIWTVRLFLENIILDGHWNYKGLFFLVLTRLKGFSPRLREVD